MEAERKKMIEKKVLKEFGVDTRGALTLKGRIEYDILTFKELFGESFHTLIEVYDIAGGKRRCGLDRTRIEDEDVVSEYAGYKIVIPIKNIVHYELLIGMAKKTLKLKDGSITV